MTTIEPRHGTSMLVGARIDAGCPPMDGLAGVIGRRGAVDERLALAVAARGADVERAVSVNGRLASAGGRSRVRCWALATDGSTPRMGR